MPSTGNEDGLRRCAEFHETRAPTAAAAVGAAHEAARQCARAPASWEGTPLQVVAKAALKMHGAALRIGQLLSLRGVHVFASRGEPCVAPSCLVRAAAAGTAAK